MPGKNIKYPLGPLWWFIIVVSVCCLVMVLASCNAVKQVLKDPAKKEIVGREWEKENPCVTNDSITYLPGRIDSIPFPIPVIDTQSTRRIKDSLIIAYNEKLTNKVSDCSREINEAYDVGYNQARYELSKQKIPDKKPDTIRIDKTDLRRLQIAKDSINYYHGLVNQLTADKKTERKRGNKFLLWFLGSISLSVIVGAFSIYRKIKKGKLKLT